MRTVDGLTDATAICAGLPATVMLASCPQTTRGASANPAPAVATRFSASRREVDMRASYIG